MRGCRPWRGRRLRSVPSPPGRRARRLCGSRSPARSPAGRPSAPASGRGRRAPGCSRTGSRSSRFETVDRRLGVGRARVGRVGGQQLELRDVARGEVVALGVELEDDAVAAVARAAAGRGRRASRLPPGADVEQAGGELGFGAGGGDVGDDRRRAEQREAAGGRRRQAVVGGAGLVGARGGGAGAAAGDRVEGGADRRVAGAGDDRLRGGAVEADLARREAPSRSPPCTGLPRAPPQVVVSASALEAAAPARRPSGSGRTRRSGALRKSASSAGLFWLRAWPSSMKKSEIGSPGYWVRVRL